MITLWERLSEEQQLILLENQIQYPTLYSSIISDLKTLTSWNNLKVDTANYLINDLTENKTDFITDLYNIFKR